MSIYNILLRYFSLLAVDYITMHTGDRQEIEKSDSSSTK
jgi:hypothetical protein